MRMINLGLALNQTHQSKLALVRLPEIDHMKEFIVYIVILSKKKNQDNLCTQFCMQFYHPDKVTVLHNDWSDQFLQCNTAVTLNLFHLYIEGSVTGHKELDTPKMCC